MGAAVQAPEAVRLAEPSGDPLRGWLREQITRGGFTRTAHFCRAAKLRPLNITRFLNGRSPFLSEASIAALATYTGEPEEALLLLQGNMTAEENIRQSSRRLGAAMHEKHPKGDPIWKGRSTEALRAGHKRWLSDEGAVAQRRHATSMTHLKGWASDEDTPAFPRWVAGRMVELDMDRGNLAPLLGRSVSRLRLDLLRWRKGGVPSPTTIREFEAVLGPMPIQAAITVSKARSATSGGRRSQELLKARAKKWTREQLEKKIDELGDGARSDVVAARLSKLPYGKHLGLKAYKIYLLAKVARMRLRIVQPHNRPGGGAYITSAGRLLVALHGLERRTTKKFYQCQLCGQLWEKDGKDSRGELCFPCWRREYQPILSRWLLAGSVGARPAAPRRKGGHLITPDELQQRLIFFFRYRLLGNGPSITTGANAYRAFSRTHEMLAASRLPWCQRVVGLLAQL